MMAAVSRRHELKYGLVAGVDEVGIGSLAGPVVAAAVIIKDHKKIPGLDDSKKLPAKKRVELFNRIIEASLSIGVGIIDNSTIDRINILQASLRAMTSAVYSLSSMPEHVLVDGIRKIPNIDIPQTAIKHGDSISHAIAAASVVAKVLRDQIMDRYDLLYPHFGFADHKGYGTEEHINKLKKHGPSSIHRLSYLPVIEYLASKGLIFV
jgi:ribonuclease HII